MNLVIIFLIALLFSTSLVGFSKKFAHHFNIGALPSPRNIHKGFIPLLGGVGIFAGTLIGICIALLFDLISWNEILLKKHFFLGLFVIVLTGLFDDIKALKSGSKFIGAFLAAIIIVYGGCSIESFISPDGSTLSLGWFTYPFSILWIVLIINSVNLMDGLDGLAGGISLLAIFGFLFIAFSNSHIFLVVLAVSALGGILGFLKYNKHPASIFMGDIGSLQLGFLLAYFSIEALKVGGTNHVYFLASLVIMGVPLTDSLISFFRRLGRGVNPFKADREHVHHRFLNLGLTHWQTVIILNLLSVFYTLIGIFMFIYMEMAGDLLFLIAFVFSIYWAWRLGYLETRRTVAFGFEELETSTAIRPLVHWNKFLHQLYILVGDLASINLALYITYWFKFHSGIFQPPATHSIQDYVITPVFLLFSIGWILFFWLNGLYIMPWDISRFDKTFRVSKVITGGVIVWYIVFSILNWDIKNLFSQSQLSTLGFYWVVMIIFVNGIRLLIIKLEKQSHILEYSFKNTLIIGANRKAKNVIRDIDSNPHMLYKVVGVLERTKEHPNFEGYPVLGDYKDLASIIHSEKIEEVIIALGRNAREDLLQIIGICDRLQVIVKTLPELQEIVTGRSQNLAGHFLVRVFPERMVLWQWLVKRSLDILFSTLFILLFLPLFVILGALIKIRFRSTIFVTKSGFGRNGRVFKMLYFRVTKKDFPETEDYREQLRKITLTKLGKFLFQRNLYKLPQFFNIFIGDMSLVGPRPESIEWYKEYQDKLRFLHRRVLVRPGLTGLSQVKYRYEKSQKAFMERMKYDIYYTENISINLDLRIIIRSILLFFIKPKKERVKLA
jgi:UDP-GlcNAc:undecaprenyl-phosphate GlcNAc-1-phosphate transferase